VNRPLRLYIQASRGAGQRLAAHALADELGTTLMMVDLGIALGADPDFTWVPAHIICQQMLLGSVVYLDGYDQLDAPDRRAARLRLQQSLAHSDGPVVISGQTAWRVEDPESFEIFSLGIDLPAYPEGRAWWEHELRTRELSMDDSHV
jgi:hypothetical protein